MPKKINITVDCPLDEFDFSQVTSTDTVLHVKGKHCPRGEARWPALDVPDDHFNPDKPEYKINLSRTVERLEDVEDNKEGSFKGLVDFLHGYAEHIHQLRIKEADAKKAAKFKKYNLCRNVHEVTDNDGEDTDVREVRLKQRQFIPGDPKQRDMKPPVVDSKGKPVEDVGSIGNGSVVKVAFSLYPYAADATQKYGVSMRLSAVQLLKLVEFSGSSGAAGSFDEEADGDYEAPDSTGGFDAEDNKTDSNDDIPF